MNALLRAGDVAQQRRKELIAVLQQLHVVAGLETRLREADDRRQQRGKIAGVFHVEMRIGVPAPPTRA